MTRQLRFSLAAATVLMVASTAAYAGPFPSFNDPAGRATPADIVQWASSVVDYSPAPSVDAAFGNPASALGPQDGGIVSLGELFEAQIANSDAPGSITVELPGAAFDGPGADLAVFENAFGGFTAGPQYSFAELAFVEVSSNGVDFARFPSTSLNIAQDDNGMVDPDEIITPFGPGFAGVDTTNLNNLAGYHSGGFGTPFDLADLATDPLVTGGSVDLFDIRFVRVIDIPGDGSFVDSLGNPILDAWETTATSGGFDLDAVGAINFVPEPSAFALLLVAGAFLGRRRNA